MQRLADIVADPEALLEDVALVVAADEYPGLDAPAVRQQLDELGRLCSERLEGLSEQRARLGRLCDVVYGELGFAGNDDYDEPRNNYLNDVLESRKASPVLLGVLLIALGRRANLHLSAIGFPGHFLVRLGHDDPIFVDPFDGGHPLPPARLLELAQQSLDATEHEAAARLEPVGARTVAVRILHNLQRIYRERSDHARSLVINDRLFELTEAPFFRCDRGVHALALGAVQAGIEDLEAYLAAHPNAPDADRVRRALGRARRIKLGPPS